MKTKILIITLVLLSSVSFGQKKLADKFFKNYGYVKASELYEIVAKKGDSSAYVLTRIGDSYWNNSNSEKAAHWYKLAVDRYPRLDLEFIYKYIQTQISLENFEEAGNWIQKYNQRLDEGSEDYISPGNLEDYKILSAREKVFVDLENLEINSQYSDFGSYVNNNKLYFASSRNTEAEIYDWNLEPYLDLYVSDFKGDRINSPTLLNKTINTDYHEASITISDDGLTLFFTRDNLNRHNKLDPDKEGTTHLKLFKASKIDGEWSNIIELPFNSETSSTGHPVLSPDNKRLYFVSDREGGIGQTDIYYVEILGHDTYGIPVNLGPTINTMGREMFPFISKENILYFSSDGYVNLGLLDIYKSNYLNDGTAKVENLGTPYNSGYDDFAFFLNEDLESGFFSSNRIDGKGNDDIYKFSSYICEQIVNGVVLNSDTNKPLPEATVQLLDKSGKIIKEYSTEIDGKFTFTVECEDSFTIIGKKADFKDDFKNIVTDRDNKKEHNIELNLTPLIKEDQIVINPIFFDFDRWNIRTDAQYELENIVDVLRSHPNMIIKIESHTDSRGSDKYNFKLSDRRAKSTRDYLLSRGINSDRIESAKGYGESQLLNNCSNGVKCSKDEHQLNRRSYFYIIKY